MSRPKSDNAASLRIMYVDDEPALRATFGGLFRLLGHEVVELDDGAEAVARYAELRPDVVITDVDMPRLDGLDATRRIVAADPAARIIVYSGLARADEALAAGAWRFVLKDARTGDRLLALLDEIAAEIEGR